jgi:hypothetical protein
MSQAPYGTPYNQNVNPAAGAPVLPYAAPAYPPQEGGVWSDGSVVVMHKMARLPDRCVKCNQSAPRRLHRKLMWHEPWVYVLILPGILIYAIVAMILRKTAKIEVGLCERHYSARHMHVAASWLLFVLACFMWFAAALLPRRYSDTLEPALILGGVLFAIAAPIYGLIAARTVYPKRIDDQYVWLSGACKEFVSSLPPMPAAPPQGYGYAPAYGQPGMVGAYPQQQPYAPQR